MKVVITGTSCGMGQSAALKFLREGHDVIGIDTLGPDPDVSNYPKYTHYIVSVEDYDELPDIEDVNILINNAGVQGSGRDIDINLKGMMNCTKKYALHNPSIVSVLNQADVAASTGAHIGEYVASKGGIVAYTKWIAKEIAPYGGTCNSISFGGVLTEANHPVMSKPELWDKIMQQTPLRRWTTSQETAEWIYFLTVINRSCSGQDIVVENLESLNNQFIWTY